MTTYDARHFAPLFAIEDRHFWFCARNDVIARLFTGVLPHLAPGYRVLEIGCGTGNTLRVLDRLSVDGLVIGVDLFGEGLRYAQTRVACPLVQADVSTLPFSGQFDVITLFDVLEHLPDDVHILQTLYAMLKPGGFLMLTVPASMALWSYFDESAHHCRRYERPELESKLRDTGFTIDVLTPYMASIFPLVWAGRQWAARFSGQRKTADELTEQELKITPVVNDVLLFFLSQEARWIGRHHGLPFGTSLVALARRPATED